MDALKRTPQKFASLPIARNNFTPADSRNFQWLTSGLGGAFDLEGCRIDAHYVAAEGSCDRASLTVGCERKITDELPDLRVRALKPRAAENPPVAPLDHYDGVVVVRPDFIAGVPKL
jgi:hypothetical protein